MIFLPPHNSGTQGFVIKGIQLNQSAMNHHLGKDIILVYDNHTPTHRKLRFLEIDVTLSYNQLLLNK